MVAILATRSLRTPGSCLGFPWECDPLYRPVNPPSVPPNRTIGRCGAARLPRKLTDRSQGASTRVGFSRFVSLMVGESVDSNRCCHQAP
ncbi:hypothetical protein GCM10009753_68150 [Streptantibioticus ferralitis]